MGLGVDREQVFFKLFYLPSFPFPLSLLFFGCFYPILSFVLFIVSVFFASLLCCFSHSLNFILCLVYEYQTRTCGYIYTRAGVFIYALLCLKIILIFFVRQLIGFQGFAYFFIFFFIVNVFCINFYLYICRHKTINNSQTI